MTWKKVSNSDPGDADHFGGDDTDKISDLFSGVDVDDVSINSDWTFRSGKLYHRNPGNTFSYQVVPAAIVADRILNLPLLTGTDTLVAEAHAATLTNKTISGDSNTISNVPDSALSSNVVREDIANTYGDFAQLFKDNIIQINNPADTFKYTITAAAIAADRQLNLPLTTGTDTLASLGLGQTFTANNTFSGTTILNTTKQGTNARVLLVDTDLTAERTYTFPNTSSPLTTHATHNIWEEKDEFHCSAAAAGTVGNLGWGTSAAGTPANTALSSTSSHPGIYQIGTGATSGNNTRIHLADTSTRTCMSTSDISRFGWVVRIPTITSVSVRVGLGQDISSTTFGTDGIWFQFDAAVDSNNWQTITRASSTSTTNTATGIVVDAADWFLLEAQKTASGWDFYINESLQFSHTTNIPSFTSVIGAMVQTATTASRTLDLDMFYMKGETFGQRYT